jgi:hypothetical protein
LFLLFLKYGSTAVLQCSYDMNCLSLQQLTEGGKGKEIKRNKGGEEFLLIQDGKKSRAHLNYMILC